MYLHNRKTKARRQDTSCNDDTADDDNGAEMALPDAKRRSIAPPDTAEHDDISHGSDDVTMEYSVLGSSRISPLFFSVVFCRVAFFFAGFRFVHSGFCAQQK
jgi:hypothetical protein